MTDCRLSWSAAPTCPTSNARLSRRADDDLQQQLVPRVARHEAGRQHLDLLRQDVDVWNTWRTREPSIVPDLTCRLFQRCWSSVKARVARPSRSLPGLAFFLAPPTRTTAGITASRSRRGSRRMLWTEGCPSSAPRSSQAQRGWRLRRRHLPRSHPGAHSAAQSRWRLLAVLLQRLRRLRQCQVFLRARAVLGPERPWSVSRTNRNSAIVGGAQRRLRRIFVMPKTASPRSPYPGAPRSKATSASRLARSREIEATASVRPPRL